MALTERNVIDVKWDKPGASVTGHLVSLRPVQFDGKRNLAYSLMGGSDIFRFFGTSEINSKLLPSDVGSMVLVEFTGEKDLGDGRKSKQFRVLIDGSNKVAVKMAPPLELPKHVQDAAGLEITDDDIPF